MEFNQKLRGQKHHKNKARYKSKQKIQSKSLETASQHKKILHTIPAIQSSSSDETDEESENEAVEWNDFSLLAQAPISVGGHFQFKSDKNAETECDFNSLQQNNLFSLDLNVLQYSLNCISFAERCGLDRSYFTESELQDMDARANSNKVQYESYLRIKSASKHDSISVKDGTVERQLQSDLPEHALQTVDNCEDPHDTRKEKFDANPSNKKRTEVDKEELEDWLDDILGE
ncbi:hypothetical protein RN001_003395 [Aquatica leii]|uniref:Uncharacterized protein n=1 Tax=Aquatica leii TaxID=1421715 RepID=A0AAN7PI90_9COLE|nr:hypothetical protein RN001_003395 [Aquatica leii]